MSRQLAILIDPDKQLASTGRLVDLMSAAPPDCVLVGGSTGGASDNFVLWLKQRVKAPVFLFPGNPSQISQQADGMLFLSLISGRNSDLLIGKQVAAAPLLRGTSLNIVPTGYILIDGGRISMVERVSQTRPIDRSDVDLVVNTAYAGQLLGMQAIYLEAGSGALIPVPATLIQAVRSAVSCRLLVGGGIRTPREAVQAWEAGADTVVVGNVLEEHPELYPDFLRSR